MYCGVPMTFPASVSDTDAEAGWPLVAAGGCSLLYPYVVASGLAFLALRVAQGLAMGVATTVNLAFFIDSQPAGSSRARAMGWYGGGMAAGYTIGNLVGGVAGDLLGYPGAFAVGGLFWIAGLSQVVTRSARSVGTPGVRAEARPAARSEPRSMVAMLRALRDPAVVSVTLLSFQLSAILQLGGVFFPLVGREAGLGLAEIGLVRSIHSLVNAIARPLSSPFIERLGAGRVSFWSFALQAGAVACVPAAAFGGLPAFAITFALVGAGRAIGFTANAIALAEDIPESRLSRGLSSSLFTAARDLGSIAGPIIGSALVSVVGLPLMFLAAPALLLLLQLAATSGVRWSARQAATTT